jgi:hypothetical protein
MISAKIKMRQPRPRLHERPHAEETLGVGIIRLTKDLLHTRVGLPNCSIGVGNYAFAAPHRLPSATNSYDKRYYYDRHSLSSHSLLSVWLNRANLAIYVRHRRLNH